MIRGYTDFAANERTFLAWVRTAIAVIALGFVIERFNLFLLVMVPRLEATGARRSSIALPTLAANMAAWRSSGPALGLSSWRWFVFIRLFGYYRKMLRMCRAKQARRCSCFPF